MRADSSLLKRTIVSGTMAGIAATLAAAFTGKRDTNSYIAPINATSHILWGDKAADHTEASFKYTATGFLLNHGAALMWASIYEKWIDPMVKRQFAGKPALKPLVPIISAAAVSTGAYITDYYLVPKRFTPGWEKRVSPRSIALIFGALALGLAASKLLQEPETSA